MQRVTQPKTVAIDFSSKEPICKLVNGEDIDLWENSWIACKNLLGAMNAEKIIVASAQDINEIVTPEEIELFTKNAWSY